MILLPLLVPNDTPKGRKMKEDSGIYEKGLAEKPSQYNSQRGLAVLNSPVKGFNTASKTPRQGVNPITIKTDFLGATYRIPQQV